MLHKLLSLGCPVGLAESVGGATECETGAKDAYTGAGLGLFKGQAENPCPAPKNGKSCDRDVISKPFVGEGVFDFENTSAWEASVVKVNVPN